VGGLLGGAVSPIVATSLLSRFHSWTPIAAYMAAGGVVALIASEFLREYADRTVTQHTTELSATAMSPDVATASS
jgi:uncharacterized membrane protein YraQ (UPF0718 family)